MIKITIEIDQPNPRKGEDKFMGTVRVNGEWTAEHYSKSVKRVLSELVTIAAMHPDLKM